MPPQPQGMVVPQVLDLGHQFAVRADQLDAIAKLIAGRLQHIVWQGHNADRFRADLIAHLPALTHCAQALRGLSQRAIDNAHEQQRTSQADGGGWSHALGLAGAGVLAGGDGTADDRWHELLSGFETVGSWIGVIFGAVGVADALKHIENLKDFLKFMHSPAARVFGGVGFVLGGAITLADLYTMVDTYHRTGEWDDGEIGSFSLSLLSLGLGISADLATGTIVGAPAGLVLAGASLAVGAISLWPAADRWTGRIVRDDVTLQLDEAKIEFESVVAVGRFDISSAIAGYNFATEVGSDGLSFVTGVAPSFGQLAASVATGQGIGPAAEAFAGSVVTEGSHLVSGVQSATGEFIHQETQNVQNFVHDAGHIGSDAINMGKSFLSHL